VSSSRSTPHPDGAQGGSGARAETVAAEHLALVGRDDGRDDVRRIARRRDREQHVAFRPERAHLLREHLLERVVVRHRRQQRRVGRERDRRQLGSLALETPDELGGEVLGIRRGAAVAAREDLAVGEQAIGHQRARTRDRRSHRLRRFVLQRRAVGEMPANALEVIDHRGEF
jgi:hypothetical protein